jgi:hypothetical protein
VTVPFDAVRRAPEPSEATLIGLNRAATIARLVAGAIHDVNNA